MGKCSRHRAGNLSAGLYELDFSLARSETRRTAVKNVSLSSVEATPVHPVLGIDRRYFELCVFSNVMLRRPARPSTDM